MKTNSWKTRSSIFRSEQWIALLIYLIMPSSLPHQTIVALTPFTQKAVPHKHAHTSTCVHIYSGQHIGFYWFKAKFLTHKVYICRDPNLVYGSIHMAVHCLYSRAQINVSSYVSGFVFP